MIASILGGGARPQSSKLLDQHGGEPALEHVEIDIVVVDHLRNVSRKQKGTALPKMVGQ